MNAEQQLVQRYTNTKSNELVAKQNAMARAGVVNITSMEQLNKLFAGIFKSDGENHD